LLLSVGSAGKIVEQENQTTNKHEIDGKSKNDAVAVVAENVVMDDIFAEIVVPIVTPWDGNVSASKNISNQKLSDLHGGQMTLPSRLVSQTSKGEVVIHEGVNEGIQKGENPHSWNAGDEHAPQTQNRSRMVESLQK
jgi:hypothetical protein